MNEHIGNACIALLNCPFYLMRNFVPLMHGNRAVHSNMKIDIEIQAHFANQALFDFDYSGDGSGSISN